MLQSQAPIKTLTYKCLILYIIKYYCNTIIIYTYIIFLIMKLMVTIVHLIYKLLIMNLIYLIIYNYIVFGKIIKMIYTL